MVIFEMAKYFKERGDDVVIFTWLLNDPMKTLIADAGIYATTYDYDAKLDDFDVVWVHHQVLPRKILDELEKKKKQPIFLFHHLSSIEDLYLEQPYIYELENKIASKSLFVAESGLSTMEKYYNLKNTRIFPNCAPREFFGNFLRDSLNNVLVVSNHVPEEMQEAAGILKNRGVAVDFVGGDKQEIITPQKLQKYDAVVSIGKTVQYCLCSNTPVYIYDINGGCGYLNEKNYKLAKRSPFSGREFSKKTADEIATEIAEGFFRARDYQNEKLGEFQKEFNYDTYIKELICETTPKMITPFDEKYAHYVRVAMDTMRERIYYIQKNKDSLEELMRLEGQIKILKSKSLKGRVKKLLSRN